MVNFHLGRDNALIRAHLAAGGLLAYATEAVWGLGGDPRQPEALRALRELKGREPGKRFLIVLRHWSQLADWLDEASLPPPGDPRPTTYLLRASARAPAALVQDGKIALRCTRYRPLRRLCRLAPLLSTSANPPGRPPARSLAELRHYFPEVPLVLGSVGPATRPSRIVDWASGALRRD